MNPAPLRIAHLNSLLTGGGTDDQCVKLAKGLCELGQAAWVIGPEGREFSAILRHLQVPYHPMPGEGPLKLPLMLAAAKFVRRFNIQILHAHHGRDLWPAVFAARLSARRPLLVVTRHLAKSPSSWFSRRFLLNRCDGLIAVSQFVAQVLRQGAFEPNSPEAERRARPPMRGDHSKIRVIHPGIDTDRFRPAEAEQFRKSWGIGPDQFVFAVVGGYDLPRGKGQREFLRAAAQIQSKLPRARFLIIGRGNLRATLERDIHQLGLKEKAWLTPYCQDMPAAMNALDCLVHPQVGTEAFPTVLLEAFASGKPVIASALDGIPEAFAIGQQGKLVPPEDVESLAAALLELAQAPVLTHPQRQALHERVARQCSLGELAAKVLAVYQDLIQTRPTPETI
ncbi:MAG TPA: glycosyltransferase [Verrucomicrobiae bacterium]|nr:glycosyltransferase [Verrucomicrobiae bacterium]